MRSALLSVLGLGLAPTLACAQLPDLPALGSSWVAAGYPKIFYTARDGFTGGLYFEQIRPPGFDDWEDPPPYRAKISVDGQLSASGSKKFRAESRFPSFFPGWRLVVSFDAQRLARDDYFGVGNNTTFDDRNVTDDQPHFYRADVRRVFIRGEVQRHVAAGLRVLAGFHAERWRIDTLPGPNVLALGGDPIIGVGTSEIVGRLGLVFDTRDDEVTPERGVLVEAIVGFADSTVAGDVSYTRTTVSAAGYVTITDRLSVGARVAAQSMTGSPPLGSLYLVDASDRPYHGLGGSLSHRGLARQRFLGKDKLFSNIDVRYRIFGLRRVAAVSVFTFLDAGRVFDDEGWRITLDDLHVAGGVGIMATLGRAAVLGVSFGAGGEGVRTHAHTRWTF